MHLKFFNVLILGASNDRSARRTERR